MSGSMDRRDFLRGSATASLAFWVGSSRPARAADKLNIGIIGAGGKGASNVKGVASENIVAMADPDWNRAAGIFKEFSGAKQYHDYRKMLDAHRNLDAVVVSTPDHTHAVAAMAAIQRGYHVYCEKPLTRTVYEARVLREAAAERGVMTQMGNQGTASGGLRQGVEVIRAGAIGQVGEVHVWTNRPVWPQGLATPTGSEPVPATLDWDVWLGPAPARPFHSAYLPFKWRGWHDFGTGALGDMACHIANLAFMALDLGYPTAVEGWVSDRQEDCFPKSSVVRFEFPARGELAPCTLFWYDGGLKPPEAVSEGLALGSGGSLLVGDKGTMWTKNDYGSEYVLLPEADYKGYQPPAPSLPRSPGHYQEWIRACKGEGPNPLASFAYAGFFTEVVALGAVAQRVRERIEWDGPNMRVTNGLGIDDLIKPEFRQGWELV